MRVSEQDWAAATAHIEQTVNYAGMDLELFRNSGGDFEDHYVLRDGQRVKVASGDHVQGSYEVDDAVALMVLKPAGRVL